MAETLTRALTPAEAPDRDEEPASPLARVASAAYPDWRAQALPAFLESRERLARGKEETAGAVAPYVTGVEEAVKAREALPTTAPPPTLTRGPARTPADFLQVSPGQSPEGSITTMVNALGLFAQMAGSLSRKHATTGLAAFGGAVSGWKLGATEKAQAEFERWKADTDLAITEWTNTRTAIHDALKAADKTVEERFRLAELKAWERGHTDAAQALRSGTLEKYIDIQQKADESAARLAQSAATLAESRRHHEMIEEHYRREDVRRERETRIKEQEATSGGGLDPATLKRLATRYRQGEPLRDLVRGFGRRATNIGLEIQKLAEQEALEAGDLPGAIRLRSAHLTANRASLTDLSKKEAEFNSFLSSFEKQLTQTKKLFEAAQTSGSPVWNKPALWYRASVEGDPTAKNLLAQMEIMANEMSRITLRTRGTAEGTRQHHRELLNGSMTVEQFISLAQEVMDFDAQAARQGFAEEKTRLSQAIGGAETSAPTTGPSLNGIAMPPGWTPPAPADFTFNPATGRLEPAKK